MGSPLGAMANYLHLIEAVGSPDTGPAAKAIAGIASGQARLSHLLDAGRRLLEGHQRPLSPVSLDPARVAALWLEAGGATPATALPGLEADPAALLTCFRELVENGELHGDGPPAIDGGTAPDGRARLRLRLGGPAPAFEPLSRILEPFRSGRERPGVGLALVGVLLRRMGGALAVAPDAHGICVTVDLTQAATGSDDG